MPSEQLPILLGLFADLLPGSYSKTELRGLVFGPALQLEEAIRAGSGGSFADLLAREGQDGGVLILKPDGSGLIEIEGTAPSADVERVKLGRFFRVEFPARPGCPHLVALQGAQRVWAPVPVSLTEGPLRRALLPGADESGSPRFMRERRDTGLHRFVCLQSAESFPPLTGAHQRDGLVFDPRTLDRLVEFYEGLPITRRACFVLTVSIEPEPSP